MTCRKYAYFTTVVNRTLVLRLSTVAYFTVVLGEIFLIWNPNYSPAQSILPYLSTKDCGRQFPMPLKQSDCAMISVV